MMMRLRTRAALGLVTSLVSVACLRPTEQRAERDLEVGKATVSGARFVVSDGLAAVRQASASKLVLWSSAPAYTLRAELSPDAATTWELSVRNCVRDTVLEPSSVIIESLPTELETEKAWRIELPPAATTMLRIAPPDADTPGPFRFALLSDIQEAIDRLVDIHQRINSEPDIRFLLGAGDLTQQGGADELERYQRELRSLRVPYYTTLGNHELGTEDGRAWQRYFGRASFRFVYRGVQFSMLDSGSATLDPLVYDWLDGWLAEGEDRLHIAAMHIPPVDPIGVRNGSFASRNEAAKLLVRLANAGVDMTLYGHIHSYYDFDNAGIPARISGGGGAIPERFDGYGRHFLVVDADAEQSSIATRIVQVD
jgi:predicted phosphodiesterase